MKKYDCLKCEEITILGLPFHKTNQTYSRIKESFVEKLKEANPKLISLGNCSSGVAINFKTNSTKLNISYTLDRLPHHFNMTAMNEIGFDLYLEIEGKLRFYSGVKLTEAKLEYEQSFFSDLPSTEKEVLIYFPLYSGVKDIKVIIDEEAVITKSTSFTSKKPFVFYGTSITQGGCSSRSGMCYTNLISRHYQRETINLGFSGNALLEEEMAMMISEIKDKEIVFIDADENALKHNTFYSNLERFLDVLRENNKGLKIVFISRVMTLLNKPFYEEARLYAEKLINKKRQLGDNYLYYLDGKTLFSEDDYDEYTVDTIHFTDLGYWEFSKRLIEYIDKL